MYIDSGELCTLCPAGAQILVPPMALMTTLHTSISIANTFNEFAIQLYMTQLASYIFTVYVTRIIQGLDQGPPATSQPTAHSDRQRD